MRPNLLELNLMSPNLQWLIANKGEMLWSENIPVKKGSFQHEIIEKFENLPEEKKKDYYHKLMAVMID